MIFADCQKHLHFSFWSRDLAWRFAEMSAQAYRYSSLSVDDIRRRWDAHGAHRITCGSQSVLVIWDSDDVVIAFEGSNPTADDWVANADTDSVEVNRGVFAHQGFVGEYQKVADALDDLLKSNKVKASVKRRHVCGHSQGGSIAEIASIKLSPLTVYTYGTPKTFRRSGAVTAWSSWYHWRSNDGVPHLPISGGLHHGSKLCYVRQRAGGGGIPEPSFWQLAFLKLRSYRLFDTFNDHDIRGYVESLAPCKS